MNASDELESVIHLLQAELRQQTEYTANAVREAMRLKAIVDSMPAPAALLALRECAEVLRNLDCIGLYSPRIREALDALDAAERIT